MLIFGALGALGALSYAHVVIQVWLLTREISSKTRPDLG